MSEFGHEARIVAPHFDVDFYRESYPDLAAAETDYLLHYMTVGWVEGRNPCRSFDTVGYLLDHPDVAAYGMNPFYHYHQHGKAEGRKARPGYSPPDRLALLGVAEQVDWLGTLAPEVDEEYYRGVAGLKNANNVNHVAHFAYVGWRKGFSPNDTIDMGSLLSQQFQAANLMVNPLLAELLSAAGKLDNDVESEPEVEADSLSFVELDHQMHDDDLKIYTDFPDDDPEPNLNEEEMEEGNPEWDNQDDPAAAPVDVSFIRQVVVKAFDPAYYTSTYPDIASAGIDPLDHFLHAGWREGRNPSSDFDTKYYLAVNQDIASGGLNPFWHYLVAGKAEGRASKRPGGYKREIIDQARSARQRSEDYAVAVPTVIPAESVVDQVAGALSGGQGFVLSLSHDHYVTVTGGTQILIADEQKAYVAQGMTYIHLSPARPGLTMIAASHDFLVNLIVDGVPSGCTNLRAFITAISKRKSLATKCNALVVHSVLGFDGADIVALVDTFKPKNRYYWLHDYSSICSGYNLLRNDATFCGAPPVGSITCRICINGADRATHLETIENLFKRCKFDVLSPSEFTLALWKEKMGHLPVGRTLAHPHWTLGAPTPVRSRIVRDDTIHVAFVGYPNASKGWPLFVELVARCQDDPSYRFSHFAVAGSPTLPGVSFVETKVSPDDRLAMVQALSKNWVDVVLVLSPWPETFSFVAYEAVSAGCHVVCLADSGNVAAMVNKLGRGIVLEDDKALLELFDGVGLKDLMSKAGPRVRHAIEQTGTTATVPAIGAKEGRPE